VLTHEPSVSSPSNLKRLRCELYIDSTNPAQVEQRFLKLCELRNEIEARFGGELSWEPLENKRAPDRRLRIGRCDSE
jgi:hypothetical protein